MSPTKASNKNPNYFSDTLFRAVGHGAGLAQKVRGDGVADFDEGHGGIADCGLGIADWKRERDVNPCANPEDPQPGWNRPGARCGLPGRCRQLRG